MRTDKIRKYLIPNIPYLFILWAFLKLGTAYRLAAGNDFAHKLIGLGQTIGPAFADFAPGLVPLDWLVGIVGAVGFRLLIYFKSKNAKKFRRDAEYGSARWGTEKDIKPFVDPKFENNVILTGTEFLTMNTRPKIPANARNLNCCIIGSSGSGKTRFWLTPQLLQAHSSYVVVDPKGGVLGQVGAFLQKRGYKIHSVLRDVVASYYGDFEQKKCVPYIVIPNPPAIIWGDPDALTRIFSNVVYNALVHGEGNYQITAAIEEAQTVITIKNASSSIQQEDIPHLFDRFYTTDQSRTKKTTGLGLAIAQRLVTRMGGQISASLQNGIFAIKIVFPIANF